MSTWADLKICHMPADSFVFKQNIYFSFLRIKEVGGSQNESFFVAFINVWPLNRLNLQPIKSLEAAVSFPTLS